MRTLLFAMLLAVQPAFAQDTYNFYFQKTDHATEMVQVRNGDAAAPIKVGPTDPLSAPTTNSAMPATASVSSAPALATNVAAPPVAQPNIFTPKNYWQLEAGLGTFADHVQNVNQAGALKLQYNWNKYFAAEAQLIGGRSTYNYDYDNGHSLQFAGGLGFVVEPIHIELFGWDLIDLGVDGGLMSTNGKENNASSNQFGVAPYVGGNIALNISERISGRMDMKLENMNTAFGQATLGLGYKF